MRTIAAVAASAGSAFPYRAQIRHRQLQRRLGGGGRGGLLGARRHCGLQFTDNDLLQMFLPDKIQYYFESAQNTRDYGSQKSYSKYAPALPARPALASY